MGEKKHILYVQTSGVETPVRLYTSFVLGTVARSMDIEATVYFTAQGVTVLKRGAADTLRTGNLPTVKRVMEQALAAGVKFLACEQSLNLFNLRKEEIIDGVKIVGFATLNDLVLEADGAVWF